jgi:GTP cyclohydrolase IA
MTSEITEVIDNLLNPRGVAVAIEAAHAGMPTRGVHKEGITMTTYKMLAVYEQGAQLRAAFLSSIRASMPSGLN